MDSEDPLTTVEAFLALYERESISDDKEWRSKPLTEEVCAALLSTGFPAETLLLNKKLPLGALRTIARDSDPRIRCMIADKRSAGPLLAELSIDPSVTVRMRVVWNAKIPRELLDVLTRDPAVEVRDAAKRRLANLGA